MKHQQAVYLQEMGITRWQVRKPTLFSHLSVTVPVDLSHYSLLVLSSEADFSHPLMKKILKAFNFPVDAVYNCSVAEFENLQGPLPEYIWSTFGEISEPVGHKLLTSPPVAELENSPPQKKALWEQFCAFN
ncbi:DNA polymerase III subunit psi [Psychromonas antarctica]|uniref:DNA polymerase III subunit psi n=1 Tax=Psychromonas antarctica TaxID=67573 RepID=UPI001EE8C489|nr:DNA polymerase III subunit psi [Psychromonas antarctica]MCG6200186.1 DNA polymerase III subunit psi [Psychromonas antarctica]